MSIFRIWFVIVERTLFIHHSLNKKPKNSFSTFTFYKALYINQKL